LPDLWKGNTKQKAKHYRVGLHSPEWTNRFVDDVRELSGARTSST